MPVAPELAMASVAVKFASCAVLMPVSAVMAAEAVPTGTVTVTSQVTVTVSPATDVLAVRMAGSGTTYRDGADATSPVSAEMTHASSAFLLATLDATDAPTPPVVASADTLTVSSTRGSGDADTGDALRLGVAAGVTAAYTGATGAAKYEI